MKVIVFSEYGTAEVLKIVDKIQPVISEGECLIQIKACGLNPVDTKLRSGKLRDGICISLPFIPGHDIAGVVVEVSKEAAHFFQVGDEVVAMSELFHGGGNAEFVCISKEKLAKKPKEISFIEAASIPIAALTALQALRDFSCIQKKQNVLIHRGAGGVGSFAVQLAKYFGAKVFSTASENNQDYLYSLGVDRMINYQTEDFVKIACEIGGMDIVLESVGDINYCKSIQATKKNGFVPSIVNPPDADSLTLAREKNIKTDFMLVESSAKDLEFVLGLMAKGIIKAPAVFTIGFEEIKKAHNALELGHVKGKLVLEI